METQTKDVLLCRTFSCHCAETDLKKKKKKEGKQASNNDRLSRTVTPVLKFRDAIQSLQIFIGFLTLSTENFIMQANIYFFYYIVSFVHLSRY